MRICLLSVFFKKNKKFINKFVSSINKQTDVDFDVVIINDDYSNLKTILNYFKNKCYVLNKQKNYELNRIEGLKFCLKKKYDFIVCVDSDDVLDKNYLHYIRKFLLKNVTTKLAFSSIVYKKKNFINRFTPNVKFFSFKNLINYNFLGYGSMIISNEEIKNFINCYKFKPQVYDWFYVLMFLIKNKKVFQVEKAKIFYRQHSNNQLGYKGINLLVKSSKLLEDKISIFLTLSKYCKKYNYLTYGKLLDYKIKQTLLLKDLMKNNVFKENFIKFWSAKMKNKRKLFWFEQCNYDNKVIRKILNDK